MLLVLLLGMTGLAEAENQRCSKTIVASTPTRSFLSQKDGTAIQETTGLMWMRCALGQEWNGSICDGTAVALPWKEALKQAALQEFSGYKDWRLPNKNELESLIEERCVVPAVNAEVFPATPTKYFWTSSPYAGLATAAWSVDFGFGVVTATEKTGGIHVRLVRDIE